MTLTVHNNADSGAGSLRDTIAAASSGDTIVFAHNLEDQTIKLTTGELLINKNLNIVGLGAEDLTISGNDASRVFHITGGATVTLAKLSIVHGKALTGGGIDNAGNLTVRDSTLSHNQAVGGDGGGAIRNEASASLSLTHDTLANNQATAASNMVDVFGGGLLNYGTATVTTCTFTGDKALGGGGGSFFGASVGGGIDNFGGATLTVTGSTFINNQALGGAGRTDLFTGGTGGAIENNSGFGSADPMTAIPSTAHISHCSFVSNLVGGSLGALGNGGALDNEGIGSTMIVSNCAIVGNRSVGGDGGDGETTLSQGIGGGIMNVLGTLTVANSALIGNLALGGNHSTPTADNPLTGGGLGGGIVNFLGGTVTVRDSSLLGNVARGGTTDAGPGGAAVGGGIDNTEALPPSPPSTLTVINCEFIGNQAIAGHGGAGNTSIPAGLAAGGAIDDSFFSTASVSGSTFLGNQVIGSAGGAGANGTNALGGAISVGINLLLGFDDASSLTVSHSTFAFNAAVGGAGGSGANGGDGLGGGIAVVAKSSATVNHSTIQFNQALGGRGGTGGSNGHGSGGGVYEAGIFAHDAFTVIAHNHASTSGDNIFP
jgi:hypothetical protein